MDEPSRGDGIHACRHNLGVINQSCMHPSHFYNNFLTRTFLCAYFDRLSLQVDGARKLALRNSVSLKRFAEKLSRRKGPGLSW